MLFYNNVMTQADSHMGAVPVLHGITPLKFAGIDAGKPLVVAGPCSAESQEQVVTTARQLQREAGIKIFRAGLWKPRTMPGSFEGVGERGLPWLRQVKHDLGMLTATEVATREHVLKALEAGIDILWIGARTSANPFAMQDIADALHSQASQATVLVKNPLSPDLDLWIGAMQRLVQAGVRRIGAIHRGFSTGAQGPYRNDPQWHVPIELHRRAPGLTILCDPSHMGGKRELVAPLSQQAMDMGFDGLFIESHCTPSQALSDAPQQLTPAELAAMLSALVLRRGRQSAESLTLLRERIDQCDRQLLQVLAQRMQVCREVAQVKRHLGMQVVQPERYSALMEQLAQQARELGLNPAFVQAVFQSVHEESVRQQVRVVNAAK